MSEKRQFKKLEGTTKEGGDNCKRFRNESVVMTTLLIRFTSHHFHPPPFIFSSSFLLFFQTCRLFPKYFVFGKGIFKSALQSDSTYSIFFHAVLLSLRWQRGHIGMYQISTRGWAEVFRDGEEGEICKMFLIPERRSD